MPERVIRLALDINVLYADLCGMRNRVRSTACSDLVGWVRDGWCPAGPVQLITSVPIIENWADVLRRKLGYDPDEAAARAWLLEHYALEGPVGTPPSIVVGSGHVPFRSEADIIASLERHAAPGNRDKLLDELSDDRHVLLSALAGRADILATADLADFAAGPVIRFARDDVVVYPMAGHSLVIAQPRFLARWLRLGTVPDAAFIRDNEAEFTSRDDRPAWMD